MSNVPHLLCIAGPCHGVRIHEHGQGYEVVETPITESISAFDSMSVAPGMMTSSVTRHAYTRRSIFCNNERISYFAPEAMTDDVALRFVLEP